MSPVNSSSLVFFWPSRKGINSVTGPDPYRISGSPKRPLSVLMIMSQAIASSQPPARQ